VKIYLNFIALTLCGIKNSKALADEKYSEILERK
jgi:hypothetical protein